jgi:hypothetical protein
VEEKEFELPMWWRRLGAVWDFIDKRDIDKHAVSVAILWGTHSIVSWAMAYANANAARPGIEVAAIIAAVGAPYMALQAAAISFYFRARTTSTE